MEGDQLPWRSHRRNGWTCVSGPPLEERGTVGRFHLNSWFDAYPGFSKFRLSNVPQDAGSASLDPAAPSFRGP